MKNYNLDNEYAHLYEKPWSEINEKLYRLYIDLKTSLDSQNFFASHPNYELPYLLTCSRNYEKANYRIMVIAQETMGWGGEFSHQSNYTPIRLNRFEVPEYIKMLHNLSYPKDIIEALMILYDERVNKEWGCGGPLWNFYENLRVPLEQTAPYKYGLIHNNLAKIANVGGRKVKGVGSDPIINTPLMRIVQEEIRLLDPHIIIFCVGNNKHYQDLAAQLSPELQSLVQSISSNNMLTPITNMELCGNMRNIMACYHPVHLNHKRQLNTVTTEIVSTIRRVED